MGNAYTYRKSYLEQIQLLPSISIHLVFNKHQLGYFSVIVRGIQDQKRCAYPVGSIA